MSTIGMIFGELTATPESNTDLYDGFNDKGADDWTIPMAYLCILIGAVYADGKVAEEEVQYVRGLVGRCRTMRGISANDLAQLNIEVRERMGSRHDFLGEACRAMPRDMHLALFTHCVDIVLADGDLADNEKDFLEDLKEKMSISEADARKTMEVIFEKNRY